MTTLTSTPLYDHDCDACTYLGTVDGHDLYFCDGTDKTLIARYGIDGDYKSGLHMVGCDFHISTAYRVAYFAGYISRYDLPKIVRHLV
jgi:hypothetical protein